MGVLDPELTKRAADVDLVGKDFTGWVDRKEDVARAEKTALIRDVRRLQAQARRLRHASSRKMCVGVFGPSQAGKSYLISALARQGTKPLTADFSGLHVDFLADINPSGDKESTGLVTRFTMDRPARAPDGFPVELRLFSETDVVKVLANSYVFDVNRDNEDESAHDLEIVHGKLAELESRAGAQPVGPLDSVDVVDLEDYCNRRLIKNPRIKVLKKTDYWSTAARIAPFLQPADRAELFGLIWENIESFSNIYRRLYRVLETFGFPDALFTSYDALRDRSTSIISVDTLSGIGDGGGDTVEAEALNGRRGRILRSELAAITAELKIVMKDQPFDFFQHTDLLDFPGYRNRANIIDLPAFVARNGMRELMIRGKVAYLFERYSDDHELSAMLLCQGPENFEVLDLVPVIYGWIRETQGRTPADRTAAKTSLFFVQTKYDMIFQQSAGKAENAQRFVARLENNLLQPYGKQVFENGAQAWPHEWTPGRAFQSMFLLRNPAIIQRGFFQYADVDGAARESGLQSDIQGYIDRLRTAFVGDPTIQRYYGPAEEAWDSMMELNDGGVGRIIRHLRPVCEPSLKRGQIAAQVARLRQQLLETMSAYYVSGNLEETLAKRTAAAQKTARQLVQCAATQRFGDFLRRLQVGDEELLEIFHRIDSRVPGADADAKSKSIGAAPDADDMLQMLGLAPEPEEVDYDANKTLDDAGQFVEEVLTRWFSELRGLAADEAACNYLRISPEAMNDLASELIAAAKRLKFDDKLTTMVRKALGYHMRFDEVIGMPVRMTTLYLGNFVNYLSFDAEPLNARPFVNGPGGKKMIFPPRPSPASIPELSETPLRYDQEYFTDWIRGYLELVQLNAKSLNGADIDIEANKKLGELIARMGAAA